MVIPKKKQLAWKLAEIASDNVKLNKDCIEMVINRIIDNASVAIASIFNLELSLAISAIFQAS